MTISPTGPAEAGHDGGRQRERGFTAVEMLIATAIMMAVTGAVFGLMDPAQGFFAAQPELSDMQQRLRVAVETLQKDLMMSGAGTYSGTKVGTLGNFFAPILPDREGGTTPDPPQTFKCTTDFCDDLDASDTITMMYVPPTSAQTTIQRFDAATSGSHQGERATRLPGPAARRAVRFQRRHDAVDFRRDRHIRHVQGQ